MTPTFSILHATYGRPAKAVEAMRLWCSNAISPAYTEYIFACNSDDPTLPELRKLLEDMGNISIVQFARWDIIEGDFKGSAPAWDAAAKASTGAVLIQGQDDIEPPESWDILLCRRMDEGGPLISAQPFFISVSDGYRKDELLCTAIMSRGYYAQKGEFLHAGYLSVFSDDEFSVRAYMDAADGRAEWINANNLTFLHRHHYHDQSVPMDETYQRENSAEAYAHGLRLFTERNTHQINRGFRTW